MIGRVATTRRCQGAIRGGSHLCWVAVTKGPPTTDSGRGLSQWQWYPGRGPRGRSRPEDDEAVDRRSRQVRSTESQWRAGKLDEWAQTGWSACKDSVGKPAGVVQTNQIYPPRLKQSTLLRDSGLVTAWGICVSLAPQTHELCTWRYVWVALHCPDGRRPPGRRGRRVEAVPCGNVGWATKSSGCGQRGGR